MTKTLTLLPLSLAALLALSTETSAQTRSTFGTNARTTRNAANRPQLPLLARGGAPANDDCANAQPVSLVTLDACDVGAVTGNNANAAVSSNIPSCDVSDAGITDVWFSFNSGAASTVYVTVTAGPDMTDRVLAVYDGCDGAELTCVITPGPAIPVPVDPGTEYLIQVLSNLDWGVGGEFTLCVAYDDSPIPANDQCSSVTPEALAVGGSLTFSGTSAGATITNDFVDPTGFVPAVWHGITLSTCATVVMDFCGTAPVATNGYGLLGSDCPMDQSTAIGFTSAETTTCPDGNYTITFLNVPAGTYYIPVRSEIGVAYGPYTLNVTAVPCIDPPSNDDCANAIQVSPASVCVPVAGTTLLATESLPASTCTDYTGTADDDVWYSFVALNETMTISALTVFDGVLVAYSGGCVTPTLVSCVDAALANAEEMLDLTGLTVNETYHYRIYSYGSAIPADPTFTTCVTGPDGTAINEYTNTVDWTVFPNPGNGLLNITYKGEADRVSVEILDLSGRLVHNETRHLNNGQTLSVNLNNQLAVGVYTIRLANSTGRSSQRVVVE